MKERKEIREAREEALAKALERADQILEHAKGDVVEVTIRVDTRSGLIETRDYSRYYFPNARQDLRWSL